MSYLITIIVFIVVFSVLVTVHEYGHTFFAKKADIMYPKFAIGMGPKISSFRKNKTFYITKLLSAGGYAHIVGDGLGEPPVGSGMNVKIKFNEENEVTYITLNNHHKFQQIEAIEIKKCDSKDDLFIEGTTAYDNERHHSRIARKSSPVENGSLV